MSYDKKYIVKGNKTILSVDDNPIMAADSVSLEFTRNVEESSNLNSGDWKEFVATLSEWSGNFEAKMYVDVDETEGYTYTDIMDDFLAGTGEYEITVQMGADFGDKILSGSIILTKVPYSNNREGLNTYAVDFQGTGTPSFEDVATS